MSRTHMPASVGRALHDRRTKAGKRFMVRAITKAGTITRMAVTASDWQLNAFRELEKAKERVAALEAMNPGKKFTIVPIVEGVVGKQAITE
jgi:hypothetical protein